MEFTKHQLLLKDENVYGGTVIEYRFSMVDLVKYAYVWDIGFKEWPASFTSGRIWYMTPTPGHSSVLPRAL
jgi:hypothetical protein